MCAFLGLQHFLTMIGLAQNVNHCHHYHRHYHLLSQHLLHHFCFCSTISGTITNLPLLTGGTLSIPFLLCPALCIREGIVTLLLLFLLLLIVSAIVVVLLLFLVYLILLMITKQGG